MKSVICLLIAALAFSRGCKEDIPVLPNGQFILRANESYNAGDFKLLLKNISDSRCPKNVECVWAGAATTTLLAQPSMEQDSLQLCLGDCRQIDRPFQEKHTDTLSVAGREYAITLLEVNPYPGTGQKGQEKEALFRLDPL